MLAGATAALAVALAVPGLHRTPAPPVGAPCANAGEQGCAPAPALQLALEVRVGARTDHVLPARGAGRALALNAMTDAQRAATADALARLADRMERERNPLVENLDDDGEDARAAADGLVSARLPTLTAAAALAPGRWASADGRMVVRATTTCAPDARCIPLASATAAEDAIAGRARFLAWPLAYGVVLRPPAGRENEVVEALRTSIDGTRVALVLRDEDLHGVRFSEALPALAQAAARVGRLAPRDVPVKQALDRLSEPGAGPDDLDWLVLPAGAVLVVPRLGALSTIAAFVDEVRARVEAVAPGPVEWLYRPTRARDGQPVHVPAGRAPSKT